jgi:hypothetical protein
LEKEFQPGSLKSPKINYIKKRAQRKRHTSKSAPTKASIRESTSQSFAAKRYPSPFPEEDEENDLYDLFVKAVNYCPLDPAFMA